MVVVLVGVWQVMVVVNAFVLVLSAQGHKRDMMVFEHRVFSD